VQLFELGVRLDLAGPLRTLSAGRPETTWTARPFAGRWLAEAPDDRRPERLRTILVAQSRSERTFLRGLDGWEATVLPPLAWRAGRVTARLLSVRAAPPAAWRRRYPGLVLVAKRPVAAGDLPGAAHAAPRWGPGLTRRQREVLDRAVRDGYYEVPRRTTVGALARSLGLGRSTVEEHLRAAESAVVRAAAPLAIGPRADPGPNASAYRTYARFSSELDLFVWMTLHDDRIAGLALRPDAPGDRARHPYLDRIVRYLDGASGDLDDLPVELDVPAFDRRVLEEVRRVPTGATATYGEIARRLGRPTAARAVGNAVARNPVPVVVPCHRVVPAAGGVGRYSAGNGAATKARLLAREGAAVPPPRNEAAEERP